MLQIYFGVIVACHLFLTPKVRDLSSDLGTHSDAEHFSYKNASYARNPLPQEIHGHYVFYILRGLVYRTLSS
jgi:hypothetical protein